MDIFVHAVVGYAVGGPAGAVAAVVPDVVLGVQRKAEPTKLYLVTHTVWMTALLFAIYPPLGMGHASHLLLDWPTHKSTFCQRPFYPLSNWRLRGFGEWEFFNRYWGIGLCVSLLVIGCHWLLAAL